MTKIILSKILKIALPVVRNLHTEMMRYRDDRREGKMQPADWRHIEEELMSSYQLLKMGIATN